MKKNYIIAVFLLAGFAIQVQAAMEKRSTRTKRPYDHTQRHVDHTHHARMSQEEELFHAVETGHVGRVRELVAHGARLNRFQREILERRQSNLALALATADEPRRNGSDHMGHAPRSKVTDQFHHRSTTARRATAK